MLAHCLFPNSRYSIWVDSKSGFRRDPLGVFEALLWRSESVLAISEHGARSSVYDEAKAVVKKDKATPEEVEVQITQYHHDGLPEDKRFNGKKESLLLPALVYGHSLLAGRPSKRAPAKPKPSAKRGRRKTTKCGSKEEGK